jgi:hypothetical protein
MKTTITALGIGGVMATSAAAGTIKVATWNIENLTEEPDCRRTLNDG